MDWPRRCAGRNRGAVRARVGLRVGRSPLRGQDNVMPKGTTIGVTKDVLGGRKVVPIASRWSRVYVLVGGERGLERDLDHPREPPLVRVLRVESPTTETTY